MEVFHDTVLDEEGNIINGASVTVYLAGTSTPATLFEADGVTSLSNPFNSGYEDSKGEVRFAASDNKYDVHIWTGVNTISHLGISLIDANDISINRLKIVALGSSETIIPYGETYVENLEKFFRQSGIDARVYRTGYEAMTMYSAMNTVDAYDGLTAAQRTANLNPDIILMPHCLNDIIIGVGGRSLTQVTGDANSLYSYLNNNTSARLIYNQFEPYDHQALSALAVSSITKNYCAPYLHGTSTIPVDSGCYTSERHLMKVKVSSDMQDKIANWRTMNTTLEGLAHGMVDTSYYRCMRLGWRGLDRIHTNADGHWLYASNIWNFFLTDSSIRSEVPGLTAMYKYGNSIPSETIWDSIMQVDTSNNGGYIFDSNFTDNTYGKLWPSNLETDELVRRIAYWANEQCPQVNFTTTVSSAQLEHFIMTMHGLYPGEEVFTKIWRAGDAEPSSWSAFPSPRYINIDGGYANDTSNIGMTPFLLNQVYYVKVRVKNDVFGRYSISRNP